MKTDQSHEEPLHFRLSSRYAEAGDVACDLCKGRKLRAYKSCMTCLASFCEKHIKDHYKIEALQRHLLLEITKISSILQGRKRGREKQLKKEKWTEERV